MASKPAFKRLSKEFVAMQNDPPPYVWAVPDEKNILTWNYLIRGPPETPYAGGEYHGVLLFPSEYPFKPPGIKMLTPTGRFQSNRRICFSMSDFHPGTWNPAWSVATILTGLLSFMLTDELTTGSITSTDAHKRAFAARSHAWNMQQPKFRESFPEYAIPEMRDLPNMGESARAIPQPMILQLPPIPGPGNKNNTNVSSGSRSQASASTESCPTGSSTSSSGSNVIARTVGQEPTTAAGCAAAWRAVLWEKWKWGVLIALAVLLSRFSSNN